MGDSIIRVENLSKCYRIGLKEKKADTFAQQLWNNFKAPLDNFKRIKSLGKFNDANESVHWALKDVNFEVKQGEVLGIIGKNGAGKSTLLKILSKITEPTSGRIEMSGRVAALLEVGTGFHPELTGRENIYMNGTILGMTKKEIDLKLDEIINFSGVERYIDTPVKFYSSGMRVRLGFSVAAHLEPEILIIDEVLAVGDYEFQQKCLGKMEDVSLKEGRTVLFVSHNMGAIQNLCSQSILIENGLVKDWGKTTNVIDFYLNSRKNQERIFEFDSSSYIKNVFTDDLNGLRRSVFGHVEKFSINIELKNINSIRFSYLLITILDSKYNKVFSAEKNVDKSNIFKLQIRDEFLVRGDYYVQIIIYKPGIVQNEHIEKCFKFSIEDVGSNFSHLQTFDYGIVFGEYEWV